MRSHTHRHTLLHTLLLSLTNIPMMWMADLKIIEGPLPPLPLPPNLCLQALPSHSFTPPNPQALFGSESVDFGWANNSRDLDNSACGKHLCYITCLCSSSITSLNLLLHHHILCMKPVVVVVVVVSTSGHTAWFWYQLLLLLLLWVWWLALCFVRVNQKPPAKPSSIGSFLFILTIY